MTKKTLGLILGVIALLIGAVFIILGVQQIWTAQQEKGALPKSDIDSAVAESQKEFAPYEHPLTAMRMRYPKNWTVNADEDGKGVSFSVFGGAVNLRFVSDDFSENEEPVILEEYSRILMAQGIDEAAKQNVTITPSGDGTATLAGSPGHQWQYTVSIGDVAGRGMQVWTIKNNRSYVFTYTAAGELFDAFTPVVQKALTSIVLP